MVSSAKGAAQRSSKSWVAAVGPMVDESNALVPTLVRVRDVATELDRSQLESLVLQLVQGSEQVREQFDALALAPPTPAAGAALAVVLADRAQASTMLAGALTLAISSSGPAARATASSELQAVFTRLSDADREYRRFLRLLPTRSGASRLGRSVWILRPASWQPAVLTGWVGLLAHAPGLDGRRVLALLDVSLQPRVLEIRGLPTATSATTATTFSSAALVTTTTTPASATITATASTTTATARSGAERSSTTTTSTTTTSTTTTLQVPPSGSVSVVPSTGRVVVSAVVASTGNLTVAHAILDATLAPTSGGAASTGSSPAIVSRRLGALAPGVARYVVLPALKVRPGASYRLVVTATFPGGSPATATIRLSVEP